MIAYPAGGCEMPRCPAGVVGGVGGVGAAMAAIARSIAAMAAPTAAFTAFISRGLCLRSRTQRGSGGGSSWRTCRKRAKRGTPLFDSPL